MTPQELPNSEADPPAASMTASRSSYSRSTAYGAVSPLSPRPRRLIAATCQPEVLRLRRLVIGEAARFPELGRTYWERGFERGLATLADQLRRLADRGLLQLEDPQLAAHQFAGMVLWVPVNG